MNELHRSDEESGGHLNDGVMTTIRQGSACNSEQSRTRTSIKRQKPRVDQAAGIEYVCSAIPRGQRFERGQECTQSTVSSSLPAVFAIAASKPRGETQHTELGTRGLRGMSPPCGRQGQRLLLLSELGHEPETLIPEPRFGPKLVDTSQIGATSGNWQNLNKP